MRAPRVELTHSTAWVAAATVGRYFPALLLTWFGSRLVARYPHRTVAVGADLLGAATMLALTNVAGNDWSLVVAIALAAVSSGVGRIQASAAMSLAADAVTESRLARRSPCSDDWRHPAYFGEIGLLHGIARTASVTAVGPCRLWLIPGEAFLAVASSAGLSGALTETVRGRIAASWTTDHAERP